MAGCPCAPQAGKATAPPPAPAPFASAALRAEIEADLRPVPGGFLDMGAATSRYPADLDSPRRRVKLDPFRIGATTVTNAQFARFVAESGYVTTATREGWSFVFHMALARPDRHAHPPGLPWWRQVAGADWAHPEGPGSGIEGRMDHPVVHVSWHDAMAFAAFTRTRLPTEAEWEQAARGGLRHAKFPWGDDPMPGGAAGHNIWQGEFPTRFTGAAGQPGTMPARCFAPNGFGLYAMTGNVWEWVADWFGPLSAPRLPPPRNPTGPETGSDRVTRGGSFLCDGSYCARYHVHSRGHNAPDSTTSHTGFRIAAPR